MKKNNTECDCPNCKALNDLKPIFKNCGLDFDKLEEVIYEEKVYKPGRYMTISYKGNVLETDWKNNPDSLKKWIIEIGNKEHEKIIDPDEIAYMEADEYNEGYKYNRLTGKIIK